MVNGAVAEHDQSRQHGGWIAGAVMVMALVTICSVMIIRIVSPSDLWDQTQPRTVSYTTDMIVNGNWVLATEGGRSYATKPPLYNWVAVPFVVALGFTSELAHKMPSLLALVACAWLVIRTGEVEFGAARAGTGWLASAMLVANYTMFKLAYLARPDMLLVFWMLLGWWSAMRLLIACRRGETAPWWTPGLFWGSMALALLTKGPPGVLLILFAVLGSRMIGHRFASFHAFRWWWGLPLGLMPFALWLAGVYRIAPDHVLKTLVLDEVVGRVVGIGPEGADEGVAAWYLTILYMPYYFLVRGAPWSIPAILGALVVWRWCGKKREDTAHAKSKRPWRAMQEGTGVWLQGAAIWSVMIIIAFTLSAGKRADYIAPAFPTAMLLAAWWWRSWERLDVRSPRLAPVAIVVAMGAMSWYEYATPSAPVSRFGDRMNAFFRSCATIVANEPHPVLVWRGEHNHLTAFVAGARYTELPEIRERARQGETFWLIEGRSGAGNVRFTELDRLDALGIRTRTVLEGPMMPYTAYWPGQMWLTLVNPGATSAEGTYDDVSGTR